MLRPLIVSGGGFQGVGLLECLQAVKDVAPVIADIHADNVTRYLCAEYVVVPPLADREAFERSLISLVRERGISHIFPATARELPALASLRPQLEQAGAQTAIPDSALLETLLDKRATTRWLLARRLPVQSGVDPLAHDYQQALFGKPVTGWGGVGTRIARTRDEALLAMNCSEDLHWIPLLERFDEYSVDFAIAADGGLSPCVLRKRVRTSGGFAVVSESVRDVALEALAVQVAAALAGGGGMGIFNVQLIVPENSGPLVSDINPRFGTSAVHGLSEGINLPAFFMGAPTGAARMSFRSVRTLRTLTVPVLNSPPAGIVFDLDDTLVDHKLWMLRKASGAYEAVAHRWTPEADFRLHMLQLIDEGERSHLIDRLADGLNWSRDQHQEYLAAYRSIVLSDTPLFADAAPTLAALAAAGVRIGILTDNPPVTQRGKLANAVALSRVDAVVFSRETGKEKPSPAAFGAIAAELGLAPGELCMVGDNWFRDALGAIRAGFAHAFVLQRRGGFVQAHPDIAAWAPLAPADAARIHRIDGLAQLLTSVLPIVSPRNLVIPHSIPGRTST